VLLVQVNAKALQSNSVMGRSWAAREVPLYLSSLLATCVLVQTAVVHVPLQRDQEAWRHLRELTGPEEAGVIKRLGNSHELQIPLSSDGTGSSLEYSTIPILV
jgi:hypothetical protein